MAQVPTITLWLDNELVIVEPGSIADKLFRDKGYTDTETKEKISIKDEEVHTTLFPAIAKRKSRPKKIKDIGKVGK